MQGRSMRSDRVFLTGFMGSGKSTIGPILANTIGYAFVDVDRALEAATGKSVNEIFSDHGEEHFRTLERSLLDDFLTKTHLVISLGGGTIADPVNFRTITSSGIVVYLKTTPEQIFRRLHRKTDRPMLRNQAGDRLSDEELRARIWDLFTRREPFYRQADITVVTDETRVGITVDQIVRKLTPYLG